MIVVIEGGDGCGKSTIGRALASVMKADLIEFPHNESPTGKLIREYLSRGLSVKSKDSLAAPHIFQALQVTNRMEQMMRIRHAKDIVLVRYWQSGFVYGWLDGLSPTWLLEIHRAMQQADLNILLDVDTETSLQRQRDRGKDPDRYEGDRDFTESVLFEYRELWKEYSVADSEKARAWKIVDADGKKEDVFDAVVDEVSKACVPVPLQPHWESLLGVERDAPIAFVEKMFFEKMARHKDDLVMRRRLVTAYREYIDHYTRGLYS